MSFKPHLEINENGELTIGDIEAAQIAEKFGTPLYVVDENRLRENYRRFYAAFDSQWDDISVCYAYKANSNSAICKVLEDEGSGAEIGSMCELKIALEIETPGEKIVFNANNKSESEIELSIKEGVLINIDNLQELDLVNRVANNLNKKANVGFRVNPDVKAPTHPHISTGLRESKFGLDVPSGKALKAYQKASKMENIEIKAIHSHIGSQILDPDPFVEQAEKMMELRAEIEQKTGIELEVVDLGGGLGIPYRPEEKELPPEKLASKVTTQLNESLEKHGLSKPKLILEPGRSIVADSSILLGKVGYIKERKNIPTWISIDAGMNALIRPALYDSYHHIEVVQKMKVEKTEDINIAGPLCESGDYLGKNRKLPSVDQGDIIAVYDVGAYGLSMSSQHTGNRRPAMVMVKSGETEIIRKREKCEDLTRLDRIPRWLK